MIFGTGFAPFTSGPMNYLNHKDRGATLQRLKDLEENYGARFKPDQGWNTNN